MVEGQKMSKSLNNFYTLEDIQKKKFDPIAFRLLVLQSHYRSQAHFSWEALQAAHNRLQDLRAMAALRWQPRSLTHDTGTFALEEIPVEMLAYLADDLNTPKALAFLSEISTQLQTVHIETDMVDHFTIMLKGIDDLLGLNLSGVHDITGAQKALLSAREAARTERNWARSDKIRNQLLQQGIGVQDAAHGVIWYPL
jgi:cysteinyl-tRNA synthetase